MDKKTPVSLYLKGETIKKAKLICIEKNTRVNDFYEKAIEAAIEKELEGQMEFKILPVIQPNHRDFK